MAGPALAAFAAISSQARADLDNLAKLVPQDALAAYMVNVPAPTPGQTTSNSFEIATLLIDQAFALGFLNSVDVAIRGWLDAIACISTVIQHPHAVMLFDLQVRRDDEESHRVSNLRAALVMHTRGDNKRIERRLQHLLDSYTNQADSTLETIPGIHRGHRLRDRRFEEWLDICWRSVGEYFVIAIGEESFRQCAAAIEGQERTIRDDQVFQEGVDAVAAQTALIAVQIRFDEIRNKTGGLGARIGRIQSALEMGGCERGVWAAGYAGRSLEIRQWLYGKGNGRTAVIAGEQYLDGADGHSLPPEADSYAAIGVDPAIWFDRIRRAYLQARSARNAARSLGYWNSVEARAGLDFSQMFSRLGGPILVHDFPLHALRLPPAWTVVVPVRGDQTLLQNDIDALFGFWKKELEGASFGLAKTADHIWYLHVGLEGPAVAVDKQHLFVSFSPAAVRQNIATLKQPAP